MDLASDLGVGARDAVPAPAPVEARGLLRAADVVHVPSRSESFGLVALEAQASGTAVVAAGVGGLRYVVRDGVTGHLVEGHDPGDHAERILSILRDPVASRRMGDAGVARSLRFSWEATAEACSPCIERSSRRPRQTHDGNGSPGRSSERLRRSGSQRSVLSVRVVDVFLSLFVATLLPAHMPCDLHVRRVDPRRGRRYISPRSEQPERPSQGTAGRDPWESRKVDWAHLLVRLGQLTSCAGGEAREAPKPNERVYGPETKTAVRGCSEHLSPRGRWWLEASASGEPEVPRVLLFG